MPQPPQFSVSKEVFTQCPLQYLPPSEQPAAHVPPMQVNPAPHALPHAPQFALSLVVSTQLPEQVVFPPVQAHAPLWQVVPPEQVLEHPPQLLLSLWKSTQTPPQIDWPAAQAHVPLWQVLPPVQARPHEPQFALSVERFTHVLLHSVWPVEHTGTHVPFEHCPDAHRLLHPPQLFGSVSGLTQTFLQLMLGDLQLMACSVWPTSVSPVVSGSEEQAINPSKAADAARAMALVFFMSGV